MADSSKTEQATPKKKEDARKKGQLAHSRELPNVLAMGGTIAALIFMAQGAISHWTEFYRSVLNVAATGTIERNGPVLFWSMTEIFRWIVPVLSTALVLSAAAGLAQGGINIAPEAMALKFDRFNPAAKLGQMFSPAGLTNVLKSLLPFTAIAWIGVHCIMSHTGAIVHASYFDLRELTSMLGSMAMEVGWKACLVLLAWSGVDYLLTWQKLNSDLKMTREEVREEHKQSDGNPHTKSRIRRMQRRMRKKQSLAAARTATVIVTNPTHYAVALRYTPEMGAPEVVAKGMNLLAQEIKAIGVEHGIMLLENKPLAQALYKTVEVGESIPSALYQAVADILVIVYRAQAQVREQEARRRSRDASGRPVSS